jgi:hypothetical protein
MQPLVLDDCRLEDALRSIMENLPEYSESLDCIDWDYENCLYTFVDRETGDEYKLTFPLILKGFEKLAAKWPLSFPSLPTKNTEEAWDEWCCHCDAGVVDAIVQCAIFGEIIYA